MESRVVTGEIDWNSNAEAGGKKTAFLKLEEGSTTVRVLANPIQYFVHWCEDSEGKSKKFNSPESETLVKRLGDAGFGAKPRWLLKVLDRADGEIKLVEVGIQVYNGIKALHNNKKWGKPTEYDIDIVRGKKGTNPLYSVVPAGSKEPLEAKYIAKFKEFTETSNFDKLIAPSDEAEIRAFMKFGKDEAPASKRVKAQESSDDDYDFNS